MGLWASLILPAALCSGEFPVVFARIAVLLLPLAVFLGLAEFGLRMYLDRHIVYDVEMARYANEIKVEAQDPRIGHLHDPGSSARLMGVDVRINADGFRDDDYPVERTGARRAIVLGDSLTFGWGVAQDASFEYLLERRFNAQRPVELINLGTGNYNTTQEVALFEAKGLRYRPDAVFLFWFINDAEPVPAKSRHAWLAHSRLVTFFWSRIQALSALRDPGASFRDFYADLYRPQQPGWRAAQEAFIRLKEICAREGIELKVVMLPELHDLADYTFRAEHETVARFLTEQGIDHVDLAPRFADQREPMRLWVSLDDAHPNAEAHRLIADSAWPFLADSGFFRE